MINPEERPALTEQKKRLNRIVLFGAGALIAGLIIIYNRPQFDEETLVAGGSMVAAGLLTIVAGLLVRLHDKS